MTHNFGHHYGHHDLLDNVAHFYLLVNAKVTTTKKELAERQGFEPWRPCGLRALQARALNRAMRPLREICKTDFDNLKPYEVKLETLYIISDVRYFVYNLSFEVLL
jgi:hypothetical protein